MNNQKRMLFQEIICSIAYQNAGPEYLKRQIKLVFDLVFCDENESDKSPRRKEDNQ